MNPTCLIITGVVFGFALFAGICANYYYYLLFSYELNVAEITTISILCEIANKTLPDFKCPKPLYYPSYKIAAEKMNEAYGIIFPISMALLVIICLSVIVVVIVYFCSTDRCNRRDQYTSL